MTSRGHSAPSGVEQVEKRKCKSCGTWFAPEKSYHQYCETCFADMMAEKRSHGMPLRIRRLEMWTDGGIVMWLLVVAVPAIVIYGVGKLLGWW